MITPFTKEEYINWLQTRGPVGEWNIAKCHRADAHIKQEALKAAEVWITANVAEPGRVLFHQMLRTDFGCGEVDDFLTSINAYPDYM